MTTACLYLAGKLQVIAVFSRFMTFTRGLNAWRPGSALVSALVIALTRDVNETDTTTLTLTLE